MLELKNVSKFYYKKGMITTGFSKVNLKFDMGEFVAITGESGSGKSTLLNVISGLDSYEEGEMYINGEETSYYSEKDYEKYRRKYIGNIFQTFNLVNSYTVYQNIELIYLLNGFKAHEVKSKVNDLIKQVDLVKYKNRKVSKLSGGQKQRVAIARALAQNTPIILADEPTGNLDKKSSENVLKILHDISKDKLVIIVTHNYDQIAEYVTRKITMNDGKIIEDKKIKHHDEVKTAEVTNYRDMRIGSKIKLGVRNAFNILSKFLILTAVYLYMVAELFSMYVVFSDSQKLLTESGYNNFFNTDELERVVIYKNDRSEINETDFEELSKIPNVKKIIRNDILVEQEINLNSDTYYIGGHVYSVSELDKVDYGRLPEEKNEIVIGIDIDDNYYFASNKIEDTLNKTYEVSNTYSSLTKKNKEVKIVGVKNIDDEWNGKVYASDELIDELKDIYIDDLTTIRYVFLGNEYTSYSDGMGELVPSSKVPKGKAIVSEEFMFSCKNFNCKGKKIDITSKTPYSEIKKTLKVSKMYNKKNIKKLTGYKIDEFASAIFVNPEDFESLHDRKIYQSSVIIDNKDEANATIEDLKDLGYKTLYMRETIFDSSNNTIMRVLNIVKVVLYVFELFIMFFISYFVIKLVLKSRNVYYSTLRILGSTLKDTKRLLNIELFTYANLGYFIFVIFIYLQHIKVIRIEAFSALFAETKLYHYIVIYVVIALMTFLTTERYSRKLFVNSVMNTYREEV